MSSLMPEMSALQQSLGAFSVMPWHLGGDAYSKKKMYVCETGRIGTTGQKSPVSLMQKSPVSLM